MDERYGNLYAALTEGRYRRPRGGTSVLFPMAGKAYGASLPVRMMLVGRAPNGWCERLADFRDADGFARRAAEAMEDRERFIWVAENAKQGKMPITRSPFWRTGRGVYARLNGFSKSGDVPGDWYEQIVWSNLYAASPVRGKNPGKTLMAAQRAICRDLLRAHVERYRPTHLLLETDWDWFAEFDGRQTDGEMLFPAVMERTSSQFVVGGGMDGDCRIVVTRRPDHRPEKAFVDEVVAAFCALGDS